MRSNKQVYKKSDDLQVLSQGKQSPVYPSREITYLYKHISRLSHLGKTVQVCLSLILPD